MTFTAMRPLFGIGNGREIALFNVAHAKAQSAPAATQPSHKVRIVLAGDSTVTDNAGWGKGFADSMSSDVEVINLSKGGRSSGSFVKEGRWKQTLELKPDYVLVQFGHNDQPGHGADRETDPQTTYKQNMSKYIDEGRAAGIKMVLVTSLSRREWGADNKIHSKLQPWADAVKQLAAEKNVALIDLHARSIELYESLGKEKIQEMSPTKAPSTKPSDSGDTTSAGPVYDGTHLNAKGGPVVGRIVAQELAKAVPDLAQYVKSAANEK